MDLTNKDKILLNKWGFQEIDFLSIKEAIAKTDYFLNLEVKVSEEEAIALLGREKFLNGIAWSTFHQCAVRSVVSNDDDFVYFDSSKLQETFTSKESSTDKCLCHLEILEDICRTIHNCADCYNDEVSRPECYVLSRLRLDLYHVTEASFEMDLYSNKVLHEFKEIAGKYNYEIKQITKGDAIGIIFKRR